MSKKFEKNTETIDYSDLIDNLDLWLESQEKYDEYIKNKSNDINSYDEVNKFNYTLNR